MSNLPEFSCCACRELPEHLRMEGAWHAATLRPSNAPQLIEMVYDHPRDEPLPPEAITLLKSKFWPNGSRINVAFLGGNPTLNAKVLKYANMWSQYANVSFVSRGDLPIDVIVGYSQAGYWSNIGVDCRMLARQGQQTLNLQGFDRFEMPESEWSRVVCHEFGHTLGALHEQMRPEIVARIDEQKCIAYFEATQGWTEEMVRSQLLEPIDMGTVLASPVEEVSIMEYALPGAIMKDGRPVAGGTRITARDGQWMGKAYPGRGSVHPTIAALSVTKKLDQMMSVSQLV